MIYIYNGYLSHSIEKHLVSTKLVEGDVVKMRLNNFKIKSLPINKKISDGSGLNLTLTSRDNGNWTFRYTYNGKAKEMGLGSYPEISIKILFNWLWSNYEINNI